MDITLKDKNGVTLHTAKKHCKEDITVRVDTQEIEITPSVTEQVEEGLFNKVTVQGDANLVPENIKIGTNIFGVEGGFDAVDTRDADAIASDITKGKTAYVNNQKVTGTMEATGDYNAIIENVIQGTSTSSQIYQCITEISNLSVHGSAGYYLFNKCTNLKKVSKLDLTNTTNARNMFTKCTSLEEVEFINTSNVTLIDGMFHTCSKLKKISNFDTRNIADISTVFYNCTSLEEIPMLNTSNATNMQAICNGCSNLKTVPVFDTSKVTNMKFMFGNCSSLTDESLNNILLMCINATSYTGTKTLATLSLTSTQATVCQGLSNYQAFLDAGWTTGY